MEFITLNNGTKMPIEGFGVFQIPDAVQCEEVTYNAIKTGYRLLDTAAAYMNEEAVGRGIARAVSDGITTREELFVTTKVWVSDQKTEETAYNAVKTSLKKLDLDYVDLILLHQPMSDYFAAYRGITKAYKEGIVKAIGVANFYPAILANLCENVEIIPAVNQVELHPFFQQENALALMKERLRSIISTILSHPPKTVWSRYFTNRNMPSLVIRSTTGCLLSLNWLQAGLLNPLLRFSKSNMR